VEVIFLDANVLFSVAYKESSTLHRLWELRDAELVTSAYALDEVWRNLKGEDRHARLRTRLASVRVVGEVADVEALKSSIPDDVTIPEPDLPILLAAMASGATHLLTGDRRHFGSLWCRRLLGVHPIKPAIFLADRNAG
jgi:predicted nucleic acid-binding protein